MSEGQGYANVTPGWVRRVIERGVQQAMLLLKATNLYVDNIYSKAGTIGPTFPYNSIESILDVDAATATLTGLNYFVGVSYTGTGAVTLTLPAITSALIGVRITVADTGANAGSNNITINRGGIDTIIGSSAAETSATINSDGAVLRFIAIDGSTWKVW